MDVTGSVPFGEQAFLSALAEAPRPFRSAKEIAAAMRLLLAEGLTELPFPASGRTLDRWRALASIGAIDLSLAKLYEGHTDALAILHELDGKNWPGLWSVWAAEPPAARVTFNEGKLSGRKEWCSGAAVLDHAVISAWTKAGEPTLVQVSLGQPGIHLQKDNWQAIGMAASESIAVIFEQAPAEAIGHPGNYVKRPGFWQGGAGIAAVWYGAAVAIARALATSTRLQQDPHAAAHLGAIDSVLCGARALILEGARWIDENPNADASLTALRLRANVEAAANEVLLRVGRALGPGLLCRDATHAQRCADLPVFLRQSHAERDLAALGRALGGDLQAWAL